MQQPSKQVALQYFSSVTLVRIVTGCGSTGNPSGSRSLPTDLSGRIRGGRQAVTQANIQLFAVGTSGDGLSSTPLMTKTVATDSSGGFVLTGAYTCPAATTAFPGEVYAVASGGDPGLGAGVSSSNLVVMAALGTCSSLNSSTFIDVDEVTTVGTIAALAPFMTSSTAIGSTSSDAAALNAAMTSVNEDVNFSSGTAPGPTLPSGYSASTVGLNTLADAIAACVNAAGGVAGDASACLYYNRSNAASAVNGLNDLYANPSYVNAAALTFPAVDLSLILGSAAIDSGTTTLAPATDFNRTARPQGKGIDRGAYER